MNYSFYIHFMSINILGYVTETSLCLLHLSQCLAHVKKKKANKSACSYYNHFTDYKTDRQRNYVLSS